MLKSQRAAASALGPCGIGLASAQAAPHSPATRARLAAWLQLRQSPGLGARLLFSCLGAADSIATTLHPCKQAGAIASSALPHPCPRCRWPACWQRLGTPAGKGWAHWVTVGADVGERLPEPRQAHPPGHPAGLAHRLPAAPDRHQAGQRISDPMRSSGGKPSPSRLASVLALVASRPPAAATEGVRGASGWPGDKSRPFATRSILGGVRPTFCFGGFSGKGREGVLVGWGRKLYRAVYDLSVYS